jgi:hypothetical protein
MREYHKINGLYKRHRDGANKGKFIMGDFAQPEFDYLFDKEWVGTEKIDGTNIRIHWDGKEVKIGGRTDKASIPVFLYDRLQELIKDFNFPAVFEQAINKEDGSADVTLYGEGYGAKIQKGGGKYIPDGQDFILFDVRVGDWWLERDAVDQIADDLGIKSVPVIFRGTIAEGIDFVKDGFKSTIGTADAEGLVIVPSVSLFNRKGERIITKLKTVDFRGV